jgi:probable phosphoglycerate mutase
VELLLIRHAEPIRVVDAEGPADPHLHERGVEQARRLAAWLEAEELHAVWSSPMKRAQETAAPLAFAQGLPVLIDEELAEFDREATSYIPLEEMKAAKDERYLAMIEGRLEDFDTDPLAFQAGVVAAVERVVARHARQRVAVVCHGGVINAYIGHLLGIERVLFFEPKYTSVSRVLAASTGERSVLTLNETAHLR